MLDRLKQCVKPRSDCGTWLGGGEIWGSFCQAALCYLGARRREGELCLSPLFFAGSLPSSCSASGSCGVTAPCFLPLGRHRVLRSLEGKAELQTDGPLEPVRQIAPLRPKQP